jgi:hypothetical protein
MLAEEHARRRADRPRPGRPAAPVDGVDGSDGLLDSGYAPVT